MSEQNTTLKSLQQPSTEIYTYLPENNSIDIWTLRKISNIFRHRALPPFSLKWLADWLFDGPVRSIKDWLINWLIDLMVWLTEWMIFWWVRHPHSTEQWQNAVTNNVSRELMSHQPLFQNLPPFCQSYILSFPVFCIYHLMGIHACLAQNLSTPNPSYFFGLYLNFTSLRARTFINSILSAKQVTDIWMISCNTWKYYSTLYLPFQDKT